MTVRTLKQYIREHYDIWSSPIHGVDHWQRVWEFGRSIGWTTDADMEVVEYFAFLHDSQRWDEGTDLAHGPRAAMFAIQHRELFELSHSQFRVLIRAVSGHTAAMPGCAAAQNPTLAACWDADRLDIGRVGLTPDPRFMFTDMAKELAAVGARGPFDAGSE